jgi:hypothetical protein
VPYTLDYSDVPTIAIAVSESEHLPPLQDYPTISWHPGRGKHLLSFSLGFTGDGLPEPAQSFDLEARNLPDALAEARRELRLYGKFALKQFHRTQGLAKAAPAIMAKSG